MAFGVYVHWPFCAAKCPYCDFNSHVRERFDEAAWVEGIARELAHVAALQGDDRPTVETVFFGGGTPSLMSGGAVGRVLDEIARLWRRTNDMEVTLEANPASADAGRFADYRAAGVNRLSLGMQALNDADLRFLGRLHSAAEARAALALAQRHFGRVSLDLIYARPGQRMDAWLAELDEAIAFGTEHLSLYQLTIEPNTPFAVLHAKGAITVPHEDLAADLYLATNERAARAGLHAYEVSNYARAGAEARHNLIYWRYGDYAGVGPGAHGRVTRKDGARLATRAERAPERWIARVNAHGHGYEEIETLPREDAAREHLLMNLRLSEGLDLAAYRARWGRAPGDACIAALAADGLLAREDDVIRATPSGRLVLNSLIAVLQEP